MTIQLVGENKIQISSSQTINLSTVFIKLISTIYRYVTLSFWFMFLKISTIILTFHLPSFYSEVFFCSETEIYWLDQHVLLLSNLTHTHILFFLASFVILDYVAGSNGRAVCLAYMRD